jgi:hypothetical protein
MRPVICWSTAWRWMSPVRGPFGNSTNRTRGSDRWRSAITSRAESGIPSPMITTSMSSTVCASALPTE